MILQSPGLVTASGAGNAFTPFGILRLIPKYSGAFVATERVDGTYGPCGTYGHLGICADHGHGPGHASTKTLGACVQLVQKDRQGTATEALHGAGGTCAVSNGSEGQRHDGIQPLGLGHPLFDD